MADIKGLQKLLAQLRAKAAKARDEANAKVTVGYTASYALFVHEDMEAYHKVGQAKFLEQPARENKKTYADIARKALKAKRTMSEALLLVGLRLQRDSQLLCPVATGALRASAFTRLDTDA